MLSHTAALAAATLAVLLLLAASARAPLCRPAADAALAAGAVLAGGALLVAGGLTLAALAAGRRGGAGAKAGGGADAGPESDADAGPAGDADPGPASDADPGPESDAEGAGADAPGRLPPPGVLRGAPAAGPDPPGACRALARVPLGAWRGAHAAPASFGEALAAVLRGAPPAASAPHPSQTPAALKAGLEWFWRHVRRGVFARLRGGRLVDYFALLPGGAGDPEPYANPILGDVVAAARRARRPDGAPAYRERDLARAEALNRRRACNGYVLHLVSGEEWAAEEAAHGREFQTSFVVLGLALQRAAPSAPDAAFFLFAGDQPVWPAAPGLPLFPAAPRASPRRPGGAAPLVAGFSDGPGFRHGALLPTPDDLAQALGLLVPSECNTGHYPGGPGAFVRPPWGARRGGALFRGGPTGRGQAPATNPRLDLVRHDGEALAPGVPLDAGLTRAAKSARKLYFREPLPQGAGAGAEKGGGPLVEPPMDPREWRRFVRPPVPFAAWGGWRYIVNVDGNVAAFRLAASFAFGAVVVLFRPEFPCWVDALLEPRVNCLVAPDFAALRREVAWAEAAPGRAEAIGAAGRRLYEERLSGAAVFAALAGALRAALAAP